MVEITSFEFFSEEIVIKDRSDMKYILENNLEVQDGKMILWYVNAETNEGSIYLESISSDDIEVDEDEYLELVDKHDMDSHPHRPTEATYFFSEEKAKTFTNELKEIFIRNGSWRGN